MANHKIKERYYVYTIEGYAGITGNITSRKNFHGSQGRNQERFQLLKAFSNRKDARELEKHLHNNCGYIGKYEMTDEIRKSRSHQKGIKQTEERKKNTSIAIKKWWKKRKNHGWE